MFIFFPFSLPGPISFPALQPSSACLPPQPSSTPPSHSLSLARHMGPTCHPCSPIVPDPDSWFESKARSTRRPSLGAHGEDSPYRPIRGTVVPLEPPCFAAPETLPPLRLQRSSPEQAQAASHQSRFAASRCQGRKPPVDPQSLPKHRRRVNLGSTARRLLLFRPPLSTSTLGEHIYATLFFSSPVPSLNQASVSPEHQ